MTSPIPSLRPPSVDVPISRHRLLFSYLGCPTAIIAMAFALVTLVADGLPLATLTPGCWCFVSCTPMTTYCPSPAFQVNVFSLVPLFPLAGVVILGAVLVVLTPGLSLLARSYGRTVRSLMYILSGVFGAIALTAYRLFYHQALPPDIRSSGLPVAVTLQFPFYLILTGSIAFILIGVLESIRLPRRLFRTYVPPPPKPPKPKRMPVPEVVPQTISSKPAMVEGLSLAPTAAVEPPASQAKRPILTPSSTAQTSSLDRLTKLKELLDSGAITKEEYEEQKQMILESGEM